MTRTVPTTNRAGILPSTPLVRGAIGLGCSLGWRRSRLEGTVRKLAAHPHIRLVRCSRWYRTPPMRGGTARGWFLNGVILFDTTMSGHELLNLCRELERRAGRRRARYWGDRTLDLDLLILGDWIIEDSELTVPHPAIADRPFVRTPLLEIWPDAIDPRSGRAFRDLPEPSGPRAVPVRAPTPGPPSRRAGFRTRMLDAGPPQQY